MAEKLSAGTWTSFTKKHKLEKLGDDALVKALTRLEKSRGSELDRTLEALEECDREITKLLAAVSKRKDLADKLKDIKGELSDLKATTERLKKQTQAELDRLAKEAEEPDTPSLLSTKMVPLLAALRAKPDELRMDALICIAGKNTAVLVMRSPIAASRRKLLSAAVDAKEGAKFIAGECLYEKGVLTFALKSPAARMAARLHKALLDQTGKKMKVKVRGEDGQLDEDGEEGPDTPLQTPPDPQPAVTSTGEERSYRERLGKLQERLDDALAERHPESTKLRALIGFASEKADGRKDFAAAAKALEMIEKLLAQAGAEGSATPAEQSKPTNDKPPAATDAAAATARMKALVPRLNAAIAAGAANAGDLKQRGLALGTAARAKDFAAVASMLDEIEAVLANTAAPGAPAPSAASGKPTGIVAKRQFMLTRWKRLPDEIAPELDAFIRAITQVFPGAENLDKFRSAIESSLDSLCMEIQDEIDAAINQGDMTVLAGLKPRILSNQVVGGLVKNPLVDGTGLQSRLFAALDEIETALTA